MVAFCVHCGASITDEFIIKDGEILPSKYVRCSYCGKMAGLKDNSLEKESDMELLGKSGEIIIKGGKIIPSKT
jgi:DNA-directed RNA polymerase subunit RPC12/RpoP